MTSRTRHARRARVCRTETQRNRPACLGAPCTEPTEPSSQISGGSKIELSQSTTGALPIVPGPKLSEQRLRLFGREIARMIATVPRHPPSRTQLSGRGVRRRGGEVRTERAGGWKRRSAIRCGAGQEQVPRTLSAPSQSVMNLLRELAKLLCPMLQIHSFGEGTPEQLMESVHQLFRGGRDPGAELTLAPRRFLSPSSLPTLPFV